MQHVSYVESMSGDVDQAMMLSYVHNIESSLVLGRKENWKTMIFGLPSNAHGRTDLRRSEHATHSAFEKQNLSSRIHGLVTGHILGDMGISRARPGGNNYETRLLVVAYARSL